MKIIMILVPIIAVGIFILTFVLMLSPKVRGKIMSQQIKAAKYMMDESKDDLRHITTNMAEVTKDGIEISTHAIKKGFTENDTVFCKQCGNKIDADSKFCKSCGKKQHF